MVVCFNTPHGYATANCVYQNLNLQSYDYPVAGIGFPGYYIIGNIVFL